MGSDRAIRVTVVSLAQQVERGGRMAALVAGSSPARDAGLWCCEFFEPYNSSELSASAERHSGTPVRPWRSGTARNEERAKRLVTGRERPAISLRSSMVEHHRRRTARGAFDGLPCLRGPDHSALTARGARLVDGGDARSIRAGGAPPNNGEKGRVMPARRELITRGELGVYEGPPRAACPRGGRTPALGRSGSRPPRTSGVMRSVEVHVMRDGVQRRDCRESAALFLRRCA